MEPTKKIEILERALEREKKARKLAEKILEEKSTELFEVSEALRQSNNRLQELLNQKTSQLEGVFVNIIDAYIVMDIDGNVLKMNQAAKEMLGYDNENEPVNLLKLVHSEYVEYTAAAFKQLYHTGSYNDYKARIITKDGTEKIVQINASIIYDRDGKPTAAQGVARDITEEIAIKKQLESQNKQLDLIFDNSPIGISLTRTNFKDLIKVNRALVSMFGYSLEEFNNLSIKDVSHPDDDDSSEQLRQMIEGEIDSYTINKRYIKKSGETLWARTRVAAIRDEDNNILYQVATVEDITKEKIAKEKIEESENRLSTLIVNLQTGILLEDENRKILLTNKKFCNLFGLDTPPEEFKGADCSNAAEENKMYFKNPEQFVNRIDELLEKKEIVIAEELELVNGSIYERSYIPIYHEGRYKGHLWSYDDITIQKNYKESLKAQKEKYSSIIANMNLGLLEVDLNDHILMANQSFTEMSGYHEEELIGKTASDIFLIPESKAEFNKHDKVRRKGISNSYEVRVKTKNNKLKYWLVSGAPNYDLNGKMIGSIGIHLDITEMKLLEAQKEQLLKNLEQQNEHLNEYAHIVSHDLKSPLRNISALLSWTKEDFREKLGEESMMNLDLMQGKVEKMDHLIENILRYSSIEDGNIQNQELDLQELVLDILELIYIPDHIKVSIINKLPIIYGDRTRIQQVFQNLLSNAVNYIDKEKGFVEIDYTENTTHYIFSIKDNGVGIEKEHHQRIFKIFNALGTHEKSTGVGLSIVKKVIDLYDGEIWLDSEVGKGTVFFFSLKKQS
ncbi:PAS domain S-box protein [Zunongwangia atlantica]|uniref:histidine kinase n=1 Tax=Zunongwangia atlantica 22II14-10F7 TaxID=1185767 RepID=A0A1Y1SZN5_9FLAO|nr:PAS domain S-box protein [Zunongwangia atlantica]ORL44207.1 sensory transduction histidine kinase [Zunongwangia atlantica 22II14-10F7]